jgi:HTH-type transcriptional regulator, competence development regulator
MAGSSEKFGAYIRDHREAKGMSLRELAKAVGVSPTFMSKVETEDWKPKEEKVRKIARVLELDGNDLVARAGRVPSDLAEIIKEHGARPELEALLRTTKRFSSDQMGKLVEQAERVAKTKR